MMKIQFSNKNMTVPDRVYSHAEQRIKLSLSSARRTASTSLS